MTKKLYAQIQGLKGELITRREDYSDKSKKYQDVSKQFEGMKEEKKELHCKVKALSNKLVKYKDVSRETAGGSDNEKTLRFLLKQKKLKLTCAVCSEREKKVMLSKCLHMFCRECIQQQQVSRNRSCPLCKKKFDPNSDIRQINF